AFAFFFTNARIALGGENSVPVLFVNPQTGVPADLYVIFRKLFWPISIVLSFVIAISTSSLWMSFLKFLNATPVGTRDPVFGRDIGFYLFRLPAIFDALTVLDTLTIASQIA